MKFYSEEEIAAAKQKDPAWYDIACAPYGIIENLDDIQRTIDYAKTAGIDATNLEPYVGDPSVIGYTISLGDYFGGAAFYYYKPRMEECHA